MASASPEGQWYRVDAVWQGEGTEPVEVAPGVVVRRMLYREAGGEPELAVLRVPMRELSQNMVAQFVRGCEAALRVPVLALSSGVELVRLIPMTDAEVRKTTGGEHGSQKSEEGTEQSKEGC